MSLGKQSVFNLSHQSVRWGYYTRCLLLHLSVLSTDLPCDRHCLSRCLFSTKHTGPKVCLYDSSVGGIQKCHFHVQLFLASTVFLSRDTRIIKGFSKSGKDKPKNFTDQLLEIYFLKICIFSKEKRFCFVFPNYLFTFHSKSTKNNPRFPTVKELLFIGRDSWQMSSYKMSSC